MASHDGAPVSGRVGTARTSIESALFPAATAILVEEQVGGHENGGRCADNHAAILQNCPTRGRQEPHGVVGRDLEDERVASTVHENPGDPAGSRCPEVDRKPEELRDSAGHVEGRGNRSYNLSAIYARRKK